MIEPAARKRASRFVLLTVFIYSAGFGIIMPVLPDLIRELAKVDLAEATRIGAWVGAAYAIFQFLMGPTVGNLGDRFGRRPVFLISLAAFGTDFLLMGLAPHIAWLFVGRSIAGGLGAIFGPANAAMADMSSAEERAASFGKVGAAFGFGFIMGPALGGLLGSADVLRTIFIDTLGLQSAGALLVEHSTRVPFFVAAAMALANGVYGYFVFPETMADDNRRRFEWKRANPLGALANLGKIRGILPIAAIYFLWTSAVNIYPASWSFFAMAQYGWSSTMVGFSLTLVGLSMAVTQAVVIGRVVKRLGERRTALLGMTAGLIAFLCYAFLTNGYFALALIVFNGLQGMTMPALNAMMSQRTPPSQQGELQGLNGSMAALAILLAQVVYNNVLAHFTSNASPVHFPGASFLIAAAVTIVAMAALFLLAKRPETAT